MAVIFWDCLLLLSDPRPRLIETSKKGQWWLVCTLGGASSGFAGSWQGPESEQSFITRLLSSILLSRRQCHQIDAGMIRFASIKSFQLELHVRHWGWGMCINSLLVYFGGQCVRV
jgi:hypothetical protein